MNISQPLSELVDIEYQDDVWSQLLDYEHVPFKCKICHEYGHLFHNFPQQLKEGPVTLENTPQYVFMQVSNQGMFRRVGYYLGHQIYLLWLLDHIPQLSLETILMY